jgi:hypothetical protein
MRLNSATREGLRLMPAAIAIACASIASAQAIPADLSALLTKAGVDRAVSAWCRGEFRAGHGGAYAAAIASIPSTPSTTGRGRYVILEPGAQAVELAAFSGNADLSCYTPADARKLDRTIRSSDTIHGSIKPEWNTTVVCAFVDDTTSVCWQYSPRKRAFVKIGEWAT